jgi:curved DNA-binding protein CbpA
MLYYICKRELIKSPESEVFIMKYFKNVKSVEELKKVYRQLARKYHPDLGGDAEVMKELNNEFDIMFKILPKTKRETEETAAGFRRQFYTQNGWCGRNYDSELTTKEITALIRKYVKEVFPECKFSVTFSTFSGGSSISVTLVKGPYRLCKTFEELTDKELYDNTWSYNYQYGHTTTDQDKERFMRTCYTEDIQRIMRDVQEAVNSYRYDDSDGMIDYFCTNFYSHVEVGTWGNKQYVCDPELMKKRRVVPAVA